MSKAKPFIIEWRAKRGSTRHSFFPNWTRWKAYSSESRRKQAFDALSKKYDKYFEYRLRE